MLPPFVVRYETQWDSMFHARGYRLPDQCMTMAIATMLSMKVFLQAMAAQDGSARQSLTALTGSARRQGCEGNAEISMAVTGNGQRTTDNGQRRT
ncbi:MAG: hypothetical protein ACI83P_001373 [Janthinobacterium sp.]|jgi:hypothetical protein